MYYLGAPDLVHLAGAFIAALVLGYLIAWAIDRLLLRWITDDRVAAIALSCALTFALMMGGATIALTRTSDIPYHPIIIPPFGYAASFLVGVTLAAVIRMRVYARQYEWNEDQVYFEPDYNDQSLYDQEVLAWDDKNAGRSYFRRHWAGHLSLPLSYWVNGAILSAVILALVEWLTVRLRASDASLRTLSAIACGYLIFSLLLWIWSSVGIWRSAYWHRRRGGHVGWGVAARVLVALSAIATVVRSQDLAVQAAELGNLAMGRDSIGQIAAMTVSPDGRSLLLRGAIAEGAAERFRSVLKGAPAVREVVLTSQGGRMLEAERMAKMIRGRKLDTRVDDYCMSACISLLLAGDLRSAPHTAKVGFHQPSFPGLNAREMRGAIEETRREYTEQGVDPNFLWRALATPAEQMWFPSWDELLAANVLTQPEILVGGSAADKERAASIQPGSLSAQRLQQEIAAEAAATNAKVPLRVDQFTTLKSARAAGFTLTYSYILAFDRVDVAQARKQLRPALHNQVCTSPAASAAVSDGAAIVYSYSNRSGRHLFDISVTDCSSS